MSDHRDNETSGTDLPTGLAEALRRADRPRGEVPLAVDSAILSRAEFAARGRGRGRRWRRTSRAAAATAAAAAIVIVCVLPLGDTRPESRDERAAAPVAVREDVDASGRVDVLDAFFLARALRDDRDEARFDVDGSGAFDRHDVDAVLRAAVAVEEAR